MKWPDSEKERKKKTNTKTILNKNEYMCICQYTNGINSKQKIMIHLEVYNQIPMWFSCKLIFELHPSWSYMWWLCYYCVCMERQLQKFRGFDSNNDYSINDKLNKHRNNTVNLVHLSLRIISYYDEKVFVVLTVTFVLVRTFFCRSFIIQPCSLLADII